MKRNTTARILAPMLGLSLLAGCGKTEPTVLDPDTAFAKHAATDVVMTVNGTDVTWSEFFYRLYNIAYQIQYYDKDGKMEKCDGCIERIREGREPACVRVCFPGAITLE